MKSLKYLWILPGVVFFLLGSTVVAGSNRDNKTSDQITNVRCDANMVQATVSVSADAARAKGYELWTLLNMSALPVPVEQTIEYQGFHDNGRFSVHIQVIDADAQLAPKDWQAKGHCPPRPTEPPPPPPVEVDLCHSNGDGSYTLVGPLSEAEAQQAHGGHVGDIIPVPAGGCPPPLVICEATGPIVSVTADPALLWPANHKYVEVSTTVVVVDADEASTVTLLSVTSDEPDNGRADGHTINDIVIVDDNNFKLRAERSRRGDGRVYTITYEVTDSCGNSTIESAEVSVSRHMPQSSWSWWLRHMWGIFGGH